MLVSYTDDELAKKPKSELIRIIKEYQKKVHSGNMTQRKKRLDYLVDVAINEMKLHNNSEVAVEKLDNIITAEMGLSPKLKEQYILDVDKILEFEHGITLHSAKYLARLKRDIGSLAAKPYSKPSKMQQFLNILSVLEGDERKPVDADTFLEELVKTGKFSEFEAENYIQRMLNESLIYESKPGYYNKA